MQNIILCFTVVWGNLQKETCKRNKNRITQKGLASFFNGIAPLELKGRSAAEHVDESSTIAQRTRSAGETDC